MSIEQVFDEQIIQRLQNIATTIQFSNLHKYFSTGSISSRRVILSDDHNNIELNIFDRYSCLWIVDNETNIELAVHQKHKQVFKLYISSDYFIVYYYVGTKRVKPLVRNKCTLSNDEQKHYINVFIEYVETLIGV